MHFNLHLFTQQFPSRSASQLTLPLIYYAAAAAAAAAVAACAAAAAGAVARRGGHKIIAHLYDLICGQGQPGGKTVPRALTNCKCLRVRFNAEAGRDPNVLPLPTVLSYWG